MSLSDFARIVAEMTDPCIILGCVHYYGHEGDHQFPGDPALALENLAYETYGKAVGCGDEYRGWTWSEIVIDIYGDDQDHSDLVSLLEERFPL